MKCENCGKEHDGSFASGRFCSRSCANSNRNIHGKIKYTECIDCGKQIKIAKVASASKARCKECKEKKRLIKCSICGSENRTKCFDKHICSKNQIFSTLIKRFGFNKNKLGSKEVYKEYERIRTKIYEEYYGEKSSTVELAKKYGYANAYSFNRVMKTMEIDRRNFGDAVSNAIVEKRLNTPVNTIYKCGWHKTWNNKEYFYRSSYELNYMTKLDEKRINYELEVLRIPYFDSQEKKERIAIPDFYLPDSNKIVEIKSEYTLDKVNMLDKEKAYNKLGYVFELRVDLDTNGNGDI